MPQPRSSHPRGVYQRRRSIVAFEPGRLFVVPSCMKRYLNTCGTFCIIGITKWGNSSTRLDEGEWCGVYSEVGTCSPSHLQSVPFCEMSTWSCQDTQYPPLRVTFNLAPRLGEAPLRPLESIHGLLSYSLTRVFSRWELSTG